MNKNKIQCELKETLITLYNNNVVKDLVEFYEGEGGVLLVLAKYSDGIMPSKISSILGISKARVTNVLNALRIKDLIEINHDEVDRRKQWVRLTPKGKISITNKIDKAQSYFDVIYQQIGEDDLCKLMDLMNMTLNALIKMGRDVNDND